jgi:hypothetical protein
VDQHLLAIAQAAERGLECPPVRVLAGGLMIWGAPGRSSEFLEVSREPLVAQYEDFAAGRPRAEHQEEHIDPELLAQQHMANVRWPTGGESDATVLTLLDAYVQPVTGGTARFLPGIRIPLRNVQAWWIAGAEVVEPD